MCTACHEETDEDYAGDSVAEKRRKATRSIIERHPELGLDPATVTFRFAPKAEKECVRINLADDTPRYEIHVPSYIAQASSGRPSLTGIALVAACGSEIEFDTACDILDITAATEYEALFLSTAPPINPARSDAAKDVQEYETALADPRN